MTIEEAEAKIEDLEAKIADLEDINQEAEKSLKGAEVSLFELSKTLESIRDDVANVAREADSAYQAL